MATYKQLSHIYKYSLKFLIQTFISNTHTTSLAVLYYFKQKFQVNVNCVLIQTYTFEQQLELLLVLYCCKLLYYISHIFYKLKVFELLK